jgi:hypothetical protein
MGSQTISPLEETVGQSLGMVRITHSGKYPPNSRSSSAVENRAGLITLGLSEYRRDSVYNTTPLKMTRRELSLTKEIWRRANSMSPSCLVNFLSRVQSE